MPQMAPLSWLLLMLLFSMIFMKVSKVKIPAPPKVQMSIAPELP